MGTKKCWAIHRSWSEDMDLRVFRKASLEKADKLESRTAFYDNDAGDGYGLVIASKRELPRGLDWEISGPYEWDDEPWPGTSLGTFAEAFPGLCPKKYR